MKLIATMLKEVFAGQKEDVTEENLQSRARGTLLMALSNKFGAIVLSTGNKSELGVGYCTLYGDMAGGLAVISDVPKTMVYRLSQYVNSRRAVIPEATLEKPPSAELRPDQKDSDSLAAVRGSGRRPGRLRGRFALTGADCRRSRIRYRSGAARRAHGRSRANTSASKLRQDSRFLPRHSDTDAVFPLRPSLTFEISFVD